MRTPAFSRYALGVCSIALLAACGGANVALPTAVQDVVLTRALLPVVHSWMEPDAGNQQLLYVAGDTTVYVFSYPKLDLVGTLTGLQQPDGECVDAAGDVFVTEFGGQDIREYTHGSSTPKAILKDPGFKPGGCAVDPTTGNLAVGNIRPISGSGQGDIVIYKGAAGKPIAHYSGTGVFTVLSCGYDGAGNLYLAGTSESHAFNLAELVKGKKSLRHIYLDQYIGYPGGVQWDGTYLAVGDEYINTIYRFSITGLRGKTVGTVRLRAGKQSIIGPFWIQGPQVLGVDVGENDVGIWKYPSGGSALRVHSNPQAPAAATISSVKT
jgi:hypothetical protein